MALLNPPVSRGKRAYDHRGCGFGRWLATLPDEEREAVMAALHGGATNAEIAAWINSDPDHDVTFTAQRVGYHRKRVLGRENGCACVTA